MCLNSISCCARGEICLRFVKCGVHWWINKYASETLNELLLFLPDFSPRPSDFFHLIMVSASIQKTYVDSTAALKRGTVTSYHEISACGSLMLWAEFQRRIGPRPCDGPRAGREGEKWQKARLMKQWKEYVLFSPIFRRAQPFFVTVLRILAFGNWFVTI